MPQLDPAPWLMIFSFTWMIFLLVLPAKVLAHTFPYDPAPQSTLTHKTTTWGWVWH
uniref:ATP synthase F0 subunit 8 n=1 Tax=Laemonema goodebeanorum TaxID=630676 RepID=UPI0028FCB801|nr:ATP synthase F0 subunit 8 [Laemonema goodebeanorum]WNH37747.1 ATP synthase F0 subunit 8 [Laemonema goodebeanorum]